MSDALIEMVRSEVGSISDELDLQNEKYMSLHKSLGKNSEILGRNIVLLNRLKSATQMRHIVKFMALIVFLVCIALSLIHHELISSVVGRWLGKN